MWVCDGVVVAAMGVGGLRGAISNLKFQISNGLLEIVDAGELQREDNRFTQRRVVTVVAVFTLAGGASPSPAAGKPTVAQDFNRAISDFRCEEIRKASV